MSMEKSLVIHVATYRSCVCGHMWMGRTKEGPKRCPKCGISRFGKKRVKP
jgi:rubrerythrin